MQKLPGSRNCFVCGREIKSLRLEFYFDEEAGIVQAEVNLDESHEGFPGVMHGGVIAAILDEATGRAWGKNRTGLWLPVSSKSDTANLHRLERLCK